MFGWSGEADEDCSRLLEPENVTDSFLVSDGRRFDDARAWRVADRAQ
jgi:hypothetical protein